MKCPKCEASVSDLRYQSVKLQPPPFAGVTTVWLGVACLCPRCDTILGAQIDPVALKSDLKDELFAALRSGRT